MGTEELPKNWPSNIQYTRSLMWDVCPHLQEKYLEGTENTVYYRIGYDKTTHEPCLLSEYDLPEGAWLDEYTGAVKPFNKISRWDVSIKYLDVGEKEYYIDASESGSLLRFIRKTRSKNFANVTYRNMFYNGKCRIFLEIIRSLKENDEIIAWIPEDPHKLYSNLITLNTLINSEYIDDKTYNRHTLVSNHSTTTAAEKSFKPVKDLQWNYLTPAELSSINKSTQDLRLLCTIDTITAENHPCKGEKGLFANKLIKAGDYIGEYTGRVLAEVTDLANLYLIDYSNTYKEELSSVWVDAKEQGNETRFINDCSGIADGENAQFKRIWVGNMMHVFVQATQNIKPAQEILVSYGERYWGNLPPKTEE